jgi:hypothetical protein
MVFWRETGIKDDEEEVDAREGACNMDTAMVSVACEGAMGWG